MTFTTLSVCFVGLASHKFMISCRAVAGTRRSSGAWVPRTTPKTTGGVQWNAEDSIISSDVILTQNCEAASESNKSHKLSRRSDDVEWTINSAEMAPPNDDTSTHGATLTADRRPKDRVETIKLIRCFRCCCCRFLSSRKCQGPRRCYHATFSYN